MWAGGDLVFLIALLLALGLAAGRGSRGRRLDAQLDREEARKARLHRRERHRLPD